MIRRLWLRLVYGKSGIRPMKGESLPAQWKAIRLSTPPNHREQTPQVRYAAPDDAKLRAPEEVAKLRLIYSRRKRA